MLHTQDREALCMMLGCEEVPQPVEQEAAIRLRMFHSIGGSGPLGPLALVDLLRYLGLGMKAEEQAVERIDWGQYPQNGTVRVECRFFGQWMPGVFLGFVESGTLAVRLDDDPVIREVRPDFTRLSNLPLPDAETDSESPKAAELWEAPAEAAVEVPAVDIEEAPEYAGGDIIWVSIDDDIKDAVFVRDGDNADEVVVKVVGEEQERTVPASCIAANND